MCSLRYYLLTLASCFGAGVILQGYLPDSPWNPLCLFYAVMLSVTSLALTHFYLCHRSSGRRLFFGFTLLTFMLLGSFLGNLQRERETVSWVDGYRWYTAVVVSPPKMGTKSVSFRARMPEGPLLQMWVPRESGSETIGVGECIRFVSRIEIPHNWGDAIDFDYGAYLRHSGVSGMCYAREWVMTDSDEVELPWTDRLVVRALKVSDRMAQFVRRAGLDEESSSLLSAMLLGRKTDIDSHTRSIYQDVGASHVLALSGLHLSVLIGVFLFVLLRVSAYRPLCIGVGLLSLTLMWGYVFLTGLSPSLVRACVMTSLIILARMLGRGYESMHTLGVAALVILLVSPRSIYDIGFQLTFSAMLGLLHFGPLLSQLHVPSTLAARWAWNLVRTSLSVQLGTLPLVVFYFHQLSLVGLLFGAAFALAAGWIIGLALAGMALHALGVGWGLAPLSGLLTAQHWVMEQMASWPWAVVRDLYPSWYMVAGFYGLMTAIILMTRHKA